MDNLPAACLVAVMVTIVGVQPVSACKIFGISCDFFHSGNVVDKGVRDSGREVEKATQDAGHAVEKATQDAGHAVEKATQDAAHAAEKATQDAANAAEKAAHDAGKSLEKAQDTTKDIANNEHDLIPVRAYLHAADIPPSGYAAYGVMALRAKPTSATVDRLKLACAAFVAYLAPRREVPKSTPLSDQMLTVWPLDSPEADEAKKDNCDFVLSHYEISGADAAIRDAKKQGATFGEDGPFLIGWSPSNTRGVPDKLVLVVDMSEYDSQDSFNQALRFWKEKIVEDPKLWRSGFSMETFRLSIRDFVDHYGKAILSAAHLSKG